MRCPVVFDANGWSDWMRLGGRIQCERVAVFDENTHGAHSACSPPTRSGGLSFAPCICFMWKGGYMVRFYGWGRVFPENRCIFTTYLTYITIIIPYNSI